VGDDYQRAGPAVEIVLDHGEGVDVEVVCRLVEQQHIGFVEEQSQELESPSLAA
jgi:hypothetical protein